MHDIEAVHALEGADMPMSVPGIAYHQKAAERTLKRERMPGSRASTSDFCRTAVQTYMALLPAEMEADQRRRGTGTCPEPVEERGKHGREAGENGKLQSWLKTRS
eukprot:2228703-Rhodomonas_salina.1